MKFEKHEHWNDRYNILDDDDFYHSDFNIRLKDSGWYAELLLEGSKTPDLFTANNLREIADYIDKLNKERETK